MRIFKYVLALVITVLSISVYLTKPKEEPSVFVHNKMENMYLETRFQIKDNLLIPYQIYVNEKVETIQSLQHALASLKGQILQENALIYDMKIDNGYIVLNVNDAFFDNSIQDNSKLIEALHYLQLLEGNNRQYDIYINSKPIHTIPQTSIKIEDIANTPINVLNPSYMKGKPVCNIKNHILYTNYENDDSLEVIIDLFIKNLIYDSFYFTDTSFLNSYRVIDNVLLLDFNNALLVDEQEMDVSILSDFLVMLFVNKHFSSIRITINGEPYYYHGSKNNDIYLSQLVYNLR